MASYMKDRVSTVIAIFWEFDKDRSGHIDVHEFQKAMAKIEAPLSNEEAKTVFNHIDGHGNSDGKVEYKELVSALKTYARSGMCSGAVSGPVRECRECRDRPAAAEAAADGRSARRARSRSSL